MSHLALQPAFYPETAGREIGPLAAAQRLQ